MVIALHLTGPDSFSAALAILVRIKPSRQSAVIQILQWGESWLQLLLQQQAHIFKSQVSQAEAQLRLLEKKIQRLTLLEPLQSEHESGAGLNVKLASK